MGCPKRSLRKKLACRKGRDQWDILWELFLLLEQRAPSEECHQRCLVWACVCALKAAGRGCWGESRCTGFLVLYQEHSSVASTETPSWASLKRKKMCIFGSGAVCLIPPPVCLSVSLPPCFSPLTPSTHTTGPFLPPASSTPHLYWDD